MVEELLTRIAELESRLIFLEAITSPDEIMWPQFEQDDDGDMGVLDSGQSYNGELWVQGNHFYDSTNFSPDNTNGTAIGGTYAADGWVQINLSTGAVSYSATGPAGATFGDNIVWRRVSECGGAGSYILC